MKRAAAFLVYYMATGWILYSIGQLGRTELSWGFVFAPLVVAVPWWIAAGIGLRLGVKPREFFGWFGRFAGFLDPAPEGEEDERTTRNPDPSV